MQYFKTVCFIILTISSVLLLGCHGHIPPYSSIEPLKLYGLDVDSISDKGSWIAGIRVAEGGVYIDIAFLVSDGGLQHSISNHSHYVELSHTREKWILLRTKSGQVLQLTSPSNANYLYLYPSLVTGPTWGPSPCFITERESADDLMIQNLRFRCNPEIMSGSYEVQLTKRWLDWCESFLGIEADGNWRTIVVD